MNDARWLNCTDPIPMLDFLGENASERKLRLFAVACCRRLWPLLTDERSRTAVEVAELNADNQIKNDDLRQASNEAYQAWESATAFSDDPGEPPDKILYGSSLAWRQRPYEDDPVARRYLSPHRGIALFHATYAAFMVTVGAVKRVVAESQEAVWFSNDLDQRMTVNSEEQIQSGLIRCIFGSPFRPVTTVPAWLTPAVIIHAQAAYSNRTLPGGTLDHACLAFLVDALEQAGCDNNDMVNHCRQLGEHVRGCWVVDSILGKQ